MSGNAVAVWSNAEPSQLAVPWHWAQVTGKPDAACGGFVVALYAA